MRILHVVPVFFPEGPGGIQVHVRDLARAQLSAGHEVAVLSGTLRVEDRPALREEPFEDLRVLRLVRDDLHHIHHARGHHPGAGRLVRESFERERPDLVHVHSWVALSTDLVASAEDLGIPTVVTLHDFLLSCPRAYRQDHRGAPCSKPLGRSACGPCAPRFGFETEELVAESIALFASSLRAEVERARVLLAPLAGVGQRVLELAGLPHLTVRALPLGYTPHPDAPRTSRGEGGPLRLATWGRLGPHKGTDLLLRAFARAANDLPPGSVELHVFGELAPEPFRAAALAGVGDAPVHLHGPFAFEDLSAACLDAALFPSRCLETFGFVIDEARELGLPLVLADLGAYGERAAGDSLVVPPEDEAGWASAIVRLATEPELRSRLAADAPAPSPTPERYAAQLEEIYATARAAEPRSGTHPAPEPERWRRLRRAYDRGLGGS